MPSTYISREALLIIHTHIHSGKYHLKLWNGSTHLQKVPFHLYPTAHDGNIQQANVWRPLLTWIVFPFSPPVRIYHVTWFSQIKKWLEVTICTFSQRFKIQHILCEILFPLPLWTARCREQLSVSLTLEMRRAGNRKWSPPNLQGTRNEKEYLCYSNLGNLGVIGHYSIVLTDKPESTKLYHVISMVLQAFLHEVISPGFPRTSEWEAIPRFWTTILEIFKAFCPCFLSSTDKI